MNNQANTVELALMVSMPKTQVRPNSGSRTIVAMKSDLRRYIMNKKVILVFIILKIIYLFIY